MAETSPAMTMGRFSSILLRLHHIRYAVMAGLVPAIHVLK
jgi:hypothetical protein